MQVRWPIFSPCPRDGISCSSSSVPSCLPFGPYAHYHFSLDNAGTDVGSLVVGPECSDEFPIVVDTDSDDDRIFVLTDDHTDSDSDSDTDSDGGGTDAGDVPTCQHDRGNGIWHWLCDSDDDSLAIPPSSVSPDRIHTEDDESSLPDISL